MLKKANFKMLLAAIIVLSIFVVISVAVGAAPGVKAADDVKIVIDGAPGVYTDMPIEINDRILLPFREILTKLGVPNDDDHIIWNDDEESVTVIDGANVIKLVIGSPVMSLNGEDKKFDVAPYFYEVNNRTYVPVRAVAELLDKYVMWEEASSTVYVRDKANYADTLELLQNMQNRQNIGSLNKVYANSVSNVKMTVSSDDIILDGADENGVISLDIDLTQLVLADVDEGVYHIKQVMNMFGVKVGTEMVMYENRMFMKVEGISDWTDITDQGDFNLEEMKNQAFILESQMTGTDLADVAMTISLDKKGENYIMVGSPISIGSLNTLLDSLTGLVAQGQENVTVEIKLDNMQIEETLDRNFYPITAASDLDISYTIVETAANNAKAAVNIKLNMHIEVAYEKIDDDFEVEIPDEVLALM